MPIATLKFPPGLFQNGTRYSSKNFWHRSNLMRWHDDTPQPIGGWFEHNATASTGRVNSCFSWMDNSGNGWIAVGTESKLYVYDEAFVRYDITPAGFVAGNADQGTYSGYGTGPYNVGAYSVRQPIAGGIPLDAGSWCFDVWGEYLVAQFCGSGPIYEWTLATASPAVAVTNSPTSNAWILATNERILLAFGADNVPRDIKGSDSEDNTDWTPAVSNQSIDRNINSRTKILCAKNFRGDVLFWTKDALYRMQYTQPPYIYSVQQVASGCGIIGRNAVVITDAEAIWMGIDNFWVWDGGSLQVLDCPIGGEIFKDINFNQNTKTFGFSNSAYSEATWFYPGSGSSECDSYVTVNHDKWIWTRGMMDRTCATDRGVFPAPFMIKSTGQLYEHEIPGGSLGGGTPYLESGPLEVGQGENLITVNKLWPDDVLMNDSTLPDSPATISMYLKAQNYPATSIRTVGPLNNAQPRGARITGRQIALRLEGTTGTWNIGTYRAMYELRGER